MAAVTVAVLGSVAAAAQTDSAVRPQAEFYFARMAYNADNNGRRFGPGRPWWAIDYPDSEYHFMRGLRRLTRVDAADGSQQVDLLHDDVFDYPWLYVEQVGHWTLSEQEARRLREYLDRGGFLMVDDFHGNYDWQVFMRGIRQVFPDRPIVDIGDEAEVLHVMYDVDRNTQIPGLRHLRRTADGRIVAHMQGPATWRGIYDDAGRLIVAINFNMDIGDAWEHADWPQYPEPMTALAYRFGVNYVIYAMTH